MKLLKIILSIIILISFTINSCNEKTIDLDPIGDTEASFFQNEEQMTQAVMAVYQKLNFFYQWGNDRILHRIWLLPSDDLTNPGGDDHEIFSSLNGSNNHLNEYFNFAYQLIARANTVLQKIDENGDIAYDESSQADDWHRGECLFLRSWMNFRLWNVYGTAPLVVERITEIDDAFPPNSEGTELLDQAISDLQTATDLLPDSWSDDEKGRVTKNAARGLLGKALVFRGSVNNSSEDFTAAINAFNSISGISLTSNFNDNFDAEKENNEESLFEFQANITGSGNANPWVAGAGANDAFAVIGELNAYYGFFDNKGYGGTSRSYSATESLKNAFEVGDPRIDYTLIMAEENHNVLKYILNNALIPGREGQGLSQNNTRILRYADVLLLKAEAIVRSGGDLAEAIDLVNQIRLRARLSTTDGSESPVPANYDTPADADTALDLIFNERRLELAGEEGHRWYDLRRRHLAGEINLTTWNFSSVRNDFDFQAFHVNLPLPENEVLQNPNLNQNDGY